MYPWASPDVVAHMSLPQLFLYLKVEQKDQPAQGIPMTAEMQRQLYEQVRNRYGAAPKGTDDEVQAG